MSLPSLLDRLRRLMSVPMDNPELLKAQSTVLSRLIPLMYFILMANAWGLTITFIGKAPVWLTLYTAMALSLICAIRISMWWHTRGTTIPQEQVMREVWRTNIMAGVLSFAFPIWGFALYPYGDALARAHIAFFMMISLLGTMFCLIHIRSAALLVAAIGSLLFTGFFISTGHPIFIAMAINVLLVTSAAAVIVLVQNRTFTDMVNAQTQARRTHQEQSRLLRMIDDMPVAVMTVDPETLEVNYVNETSKQTLRGIEHLLPIKVDDLLGSSIDVFHKHPEHQRRLLADPANLPHKARINLGPEVLDLQVSAIHDDDGSYIGPMLNWALVTKEAEAEKRILHLAHYDTLTGLPNRVTFHEALEERCAATGAPFTLLLLGLDGFKLINDTRGHHIGDMLLKQVADRLVEACEGQDMPLARLGGDEFAILMPGDDADKATAMANSLIKTISESYHAPHDTRLQVGVSIGIARAPAHGQDADTLLARADIALFAAKSAGRRTYQMFSPGMEEKIHERVVLEGKLRDALGHKDGLFVFYQPIVNIKTGKITAREALARWHHPKRGWISPGEFVPVAEESGLIDQLGLFVLNTACREAAGWEDGARIAVNISANQLGKGTLAPAVLSALVESGLSPDRLEIEVTETALLRDEAAAIGDLRRLRDMGVRVALDDFGTGYSSLAHLRMFTFDKIKIDGSFVRDALTRPDCAAVVRAVAELGTRLGMTTVAEGVETEALRERMAIKGCDEIQGFLVGKPMPSATDVPLIEAINDAPRGAIAG